MMPGVSSERPANDVTEYQNAHSKCLPPRKLLERESSRLWCVVGTKRAYGARRVAHHDGIRRHVLGDNGLATDDAAAAERDGWEYDGIETDPDVVFQPNRSGCRDGGKVAVGPRRRRTECRPTRIDGRSAGGMAVGDH